MVATDSYRLGVKETTARRRARAARSRRTCRRGRSRSSAGSRRREGAESIGVAALENQVIFTVDGVVLSSRLVEGRFPNYQQLLPESYEHELRVSRDELLEVVRRVGLLAQKNAPLRLRFTEGALDVSAQTPDVGEASESLPVPFAGEELEIGFNPEFFREGLESAESEELVLKLISPLRPGPDPVGRRGRRLPLPRHADPPERVGAAVRVAAHRAARLPQLRGGGGASWRTGSRWSAGANGAGKTNLLEAVYFGCTARSPRTSNERELVRRGGAGWRAWCSTWPATTASTGSRSASSPARRSICASTTAPSTAWPAVEARPLVSVFLPERLELVKGAPAARRAHLDQVVAALWPSRAETRSAYSRALAQRNALVARIRAAPPGPPRSTRGTPSSPATASG